MPWRRAQIRSMPRPKAKPVYFLGVVADGAQHVGIDHAGPAHLDPAAVPTHVDLDARLGEREERRAEADVNVVGERSCGRTAAACSSGRPSSRCDRPAGPRSDGTSGSAWRRPCRADRRGRSEMIRTGGGVFSITRICTVLVWLRKQEQRSAGSAAGSSAARCLAGRSCGRREIEILQRIAGRMLRRDVQGLEVVPGVFHLRPVGHA